MIKVEIWSDFACPFCFIGKRHFEEALAAFEKKDQVEVTYKSFELDPNAEKSRKVSIYEVLAKKYGRSIEWAKQANENVIAMGRDCNIQFAIDKIIPTNSFDAHRLDHAARKLGLQSKWQEAAFKAYFIEGRDIADKKSLLAMAQETGMTNEIIEQVLNSELYNDDVRAEEDEAHDIGVNGVPFFVFNRKTALSGAQPTEVFLQALREALDE